MNNDEINPNNVEKELIEFFNKDFNPQEVATNIYETYIDKVKIAINTLSLRELRRVFMALIESPFWIKNPKLRSKKEWDFFSIADSLILAKTIMIQANLLNELNKEEDKK